MMEEIAYAGWKRNLRIQGPTTELVITLDVGPRILRYAFHGKRNVFVELAEELGGSGEDEWRIRGGHRFWCAPEAKHCYECDNVPVTWQKFGENGAEIVSPPSPYGYQKTLRIEMLENEVVRVAHLLTNVGTQPLALSPWALSVMPPGGTAVIPQPHLGLHPSEYPEERPIRPDEYLPNREFVLWPFTNLTDGRFVFSEHFLRMSHRAGLPASKLGLKLPPGWIAYANGDFAFAKYVCHQPGVPYPDRGVNCELFTNNDIFELETLAPQVPLAPGASAEHIEHWTLRQTNRALDRDHSALDFFASLPAVP